jgi:hypothetical protein
MRHEWIMGGRTADREEENSFSLVGCLRVRNNKFSLVGLL